MNKTRTFDVLVVYTNAIAASASSDENITKPFQITKTRSHYNNAYAYFLETCEKNGLTVAFATTKDIVDSGTANCYWLYKNKKWIKVNKPCYSKLIFDRLSPIGQRQKAIIEILYKNVKVKPFNSPDLFAFFFDKQKTFDRLQPFSIPTVTLKDRTKLGVIRSIREIESLTAYHINANDFSNKFVIKDKYGSGGNNVFLIGNVNAEEQILEILQRYNHTSFILQPFADFTKGYIYNQQEGFTDIRMIYLGQKPVQVYIRHAKGNDFRCNEHQGGSLNYITLKEVPNKVRKFADNIAKSLKVKNDLFALDLVVSNNGNVYLMEGNIRPGIDWNLYNKRNERMAKKLIKIIVDELGRRTTELHRNKISRLSPDEIIEVSL